jgi:hypothetical protein
MGFHFMTITNLSECSFVTTEEELETLRSKINKAYAVGRYLVPPSLPILALFRQRELSITMLVYLFKENEWSQLPSIYRDPNSLHKLLYQLEELWITHYNSLPPTEKSAIPEKFIPKMFLQTLPPATTLDFNDLPI